MFVPRNAPDWTAAEIRGYRYLASWQLKSFDARLVSAITHTGRPIPEARFEVQVKRRFQFYLWKVFLPLLLMVALSWAVFWIDPLDLDNQILVAVTTILTIIAFAFAISSTLPRVPYLTFTDAYFLTCYVFVFLAIVELMTVHVAHRSERGEVGMRIRRTTRWLVPIAFTAVNGVLIVYFLL